VPGSFRVGAAELCDKIDKLGERLRRLEALEDRDFD